MHGKQRVLGITILSLGVLAPAIVPAQTPPRPKKAEASYVKRYDFDNDPVTGTLIRPDDEMVSGVGRAKHKSLVEARRSFLPELVKSARQVP